MWFIHGIEFFVSIQKGRGARLMGNAITLQDIATNAGVSKSTVSFVMQGSPLVAEATRKKVQESAQRLGYVYKEGLQICRFRTEETLTEYKEGLGLQAAAPTDLQIQNRRDFN